MKNLALLSFLITVSSALAARTDAVQSCAIDLCGHPNLNYSGFISDLYRADLVKNFSIVEDREIELLSFKAAEIQRRLNLKILQELSKNKLERTTGTLFTNPNDALSLAKYIYGPLTQRLNDGTVKIYFPDDLGKEIAAGGNSFARSKGYSCDKTCANGVRTYLTTINVRTDLGELQNKNTTESLAQEINNNCQDAYAADQVRSSPALTANGIDEKEVKRAIEFFISTHFPTSADSTLIKNITATPIRVQRNEERVSRDMIREDLVDWTEEIVRAERVSARKNHEELWLQLLTLRSNRLLDSGPNKCADGGFIKGDFADTSSVNVSPFTMLFPERSEFTLMHEFGHRLDWNVVDYGTENEKERRSELYKCTNNFYSLPIENKIIYQREDFADFLASKMLKDKPMLYSCNLLKTSADGTSYMHLTMHNNTYDNHRATFLRLLSEAVMKTNFSLPASCSILIDRYSELYNFRACL